MKKDEKGITADKDDFSEWFSELMIKAELADYTEVSGCMVYRPYAYEMWEKIKEETDKRLKKFGVKNCYFPLFIPEKFLNKEKEHVEGFSPEVAWVTEAGSSKLNEKLAVRPTSETIMYPSFSKWIRSWRDLPLRLNQWNNVVRWEFNHPVPFFRGREFLWNELHTALESEEEALKEGKEIIEAYNDLCGKFLALYGVIGRKTEKEKFAGGVSSWKIHFILLNGKCAEGPCFHYDGQNFAKAYDIKFLDRNGKEQYVYQNTYAISTRMLGVMFAIHSDDKGLILPPSIAPYKFVIVPIIFENKKKEVLNFCNKIKKELEEFSPYLDDRENYSSGYKFNEWELKGAPLRLEVGPKEIESGEVVLFRRDNLEKKKIKTEKLKLEIIKNLEDIQKKLYEKSKKLFESRVVESNNLEQLKKAIVNKKISIVPLCKNQECEDWIKAETRGAKTLWIEEKRKIKDEKCIICGKKADYFVYVGKTY
ncbi:MAG: proline--tRNA ligase [Candidatus Pacearchaeota archaeon]